MIKRFINFVIVAGLLFFSVGSFASMVSFASVGSFAVANNAVTYSVVYDPKSKYKNISLKNAAFRVHIYADGTPRGILTRITDDKQTFTMSHPYGSLLTVTVFLMQENGKNHVHCSGVALHGSTTIKINCRKIDFVP